MGREKVATWFSGLVSRVRHYRTDDDLKDELQTHLEMQEEDHLGAGMSVHEARRRARLALGSAGTVVENVRDQEFITMLESCYRDFVLGIRSLRKSPVFCLAAVLTLAIGIGANTAVFTLLHGLLLRSLPVADPGQLVRLRLARADASQWAATHTVPYRMLPSLQAQQRSLSGIAAWRIFLATVEDRDGTPGYYHVGLVGGNGFKVLGMTAYAGRLINESDDVRGGPAEGWSTVLSYGFWKDRFGGDPDIIGKSINVANTALTVVGVAPRDFQGLWPGFDPKLYLPMQFVNVLVGRDVLNTPASFATCAVVGRLNPGVSLEEAAAEIAVHQGQLLREFLPPEYERDPRFQGAKLQVEPARTGLPTFFQTAYSTPLYLMQGLVAFVLLLCCVNVSGLMMSKIHERRREFAIRTAIGAARWRLVRQYLTESFLIALAGAALGSVAAWYGSGLLLLFFRDPNFGVGMSVEPNSTVFAVTAASAVLTTLFFGLIPAWKMGRSDPGMLLKSRTATAHRHAGGRALVPVQVSLSLVLVALATLLSQSLLRLQGEYTGFDVDDVTIQTPPFHLLPQTGDSRLDVYQRMVDRIERSPTVRSAAVTRNTPMTGVQSNAVFQALVEGAGDAGNVTMAYNDVGPGYFRTMGAKIVAGREFFKHERRQDVCILNQAAANYLFPRRQALGQYVRTADPQEFPQPATCLIVGIAEDAKYWSLREPPPPTLYFPVTTQALQKAFNFVFLMNSPHKSQAIAAYREALQEIAPAIPLVLFATLREQMEAALGSQRAITTLSNFFGGVALFLSAIGLYGLLSSGVAQRTGEIGIRVALGAQRRTVLWMILSDAFRLVGAGMLVGAFGLYFAVRYVKNMLYGVSAFDPATLAATVAMLAVVALIAALVPALRAASVDPIRALRVE